MRVNTKHARSRIQALATQTFSISPVATIQHTPPTYYNAHANGYTTRTARAFLTTAYPRTVVNQATMCLLSVPSDDATEQVWALVRLDLDGRRRVRLTRSGATTADVVV